MKLPKYHLTYQIIDSNSQYTQGISSAPSPSVDYKETLSHTVKV